MFGSKMIFAFFIVVSYAVAVITSNGCDCHTNRGCQHGRCVCSVGSPHCDCDRGYTGNACDVRPAATPTKRTTKTSIVQITTVTPLPTETVPKTTPVTIAATTPAIVHETGTTSFQSSTSRTTTLPIALVVIHTSSYPSSEENVTHESEDALPVGAFVGASVGGVAVLLGVVMFIVCIRKRFRRHQTSKRTDSSRFYNNAAYETAVPRGDGRVTVGRGHLAVSTYETNGRSHNNEPLNRPAMTEYVNCMI